jgi:sugar lactone lactonase YvrE
VAQNVQVNNAWVSLLNHDGSVHTARWIGVQNAGAPRAALTPPLVLNEPYGSDIVKGTLYLADRDGSTSPTDKGVAVIRRFDMATGTPAGETRVPAVEWFNDIAVAGDGTVYGTVTGGATEADAATWQVWRIPQQGEASLVVQGAPLKRPNGIAIDAQGNLVVVNMLTPDVLTLSPDGKLVKTEQAAQAGNDGIVILRDGTKYVSSVMQGGVSRMRPGQPADLIATNIPNAASMCYDAGANQLVIPMNANNALAFVKLP